MDIIIFLVEALAISIILWFIVALRWKKCRIFFHNSYTLIDISFILAYFLEQITLVIFLSVTGYNPRIVVGLFAIIIITTASLQNLAWESRTKAITEMSIEQQTIIETITDKYDQAILHIKRLGKQIDKAEVFITKLFNDLKESEEKINRLEEKR